MPAPVPTRSRATAVLGWAALVLVGAQVGLGLALPRSQEQESYSRLIAVHPPAAWATYIAVGIAAVAAAGSLLRRTPRWDHLVAAGLEVGAVFAAIALATGSIWGRPTWGVYWQWDPRLTTFALLEALLVGGIALRRSLVPGRARAVVSAVASLVTVSLLPIVHFSVEWWRSLHQGRTLVSVDPGTNADPGFVLAMLLGLVAFSVLCAWLVLHRMRLEALEDEAEEAVLGAALRERRSEGALGGAAEAGA